MDNTNIVAVLFTMKGDAVDQFLAAFTDEERFVDWAEDYLHKNPSAELVYTILALDPEPGTNSLKKVELPISKGIFERALEDLESLSTEL